MPELPEVERGRKIAENAAKGSIITDIWLDDDNIVFDNTPRPNFETLLNHKFLPSSATANSYG